MTDDIPRIDWAAMKDMLRAPDKVPNKVASSRDGQEHRHRKRQQVRLGHVFNKRKLEPAGERQCPKCGGPSPDTRYRRCHKCRSKQARWREKALMRERVDDNLRKRGVIE